MTGHSPSLPNRKLQIVLLDDHDGDRILIKDFLTSFLNDFELIQFNDGDEAWKKLKPSKPDLFITDDAHPGIPGWELIQKLTVMNPQPAFPIIFLTGNVGAPDNLPQVVQRGIKVIYCDKASKNRMRYYLGQMFPRNIKPPSTPDTQLGTIMLSPHQMLALHDLLFAPWHQIENRSVVIIGLLQSINNLRDRSQAIEASAKLGLQLDGLRYQGENMQGWYADAMLDALNSHFEWTFKDKTICEETLLPKQHPRREVVIRSADLSHHFHRVADWAGELRDVMDWLTPQLKANDLEILRAAAPKLAEEFHAKSKLLIRRQKKLFTELNLLCGITPEKIECKTPSTTVAAVSDPTQIEKELLAQLEDKSNDPRPILGKGVV